MRKLLILAAAAGSIAGSAVAQQGTVILAPPPERVITWVQEQPLPPSAVMVQEPVVVGHVLPGDFVVTPIPESPEYGYVFVGEQRVIVDPQTHTVVQIIE